MSNSRSFYGWKLLGALSAMDFMNLGMPFYIGAVINWIVHDAEIARPHVGEPRAGGHHLLSDGDPDLAPLIDQPDADVFIRLVDLAVE